MHNKLNNFVNKISVKITNEKGIVETYNFDLLTPSKDESPKKDYIKVIHDKYLPAFKCRMGRILSLSLLNKLMESGRYFDNILTYTISQDEELSNYSQLSLVVDGTDLDESISPVEEIIGYVRKLDDLNRIDVTDIFDCYYTGEQNDYDDKERVVLRHFDKHMLTYMNFVHDKQDRLYTWCPKIPCTLSDTWINTYGENTKLFQFHSPIDFLCTQYAAKLMSRTHFCATMYTYVTDEEHEDSHHLTNNMLYGFSSENVKQLRIIEHSSLYHSNLDKQKNVFIVFTNFTDNYNVGVDSLIYLSDKATIDEILTRAKAKGLDFNFVQQGSIVTNATGSNVAFGYGIYLPEATDSHNLVRELMGDW